MSSQYWLNTYWNNIVISKNHFVKPIQDKKLGQSFEIPFFAREQLSV